MSKKVLFGFDYTNNEFVKIILYLFVGGSAALIEWAFFYVVFLRFLGGGGHKLSGVDGVRLFFINVVPLFYVQYSGVYQRRALWQSQRNKPGVPCKRHGAFI